MCTDDNDTLSRPAAAILSYAPPDLERRHRLNAWLFLGALGITLFSAVVVILGACQEPFYGPVRMHEALVHVAGGSGLILTWSAWSVGVVWLVRRREIAPLWLIGIAWAAISVFYLGENVVGYLEDVAKVAGGAAFPFKASGR